MKQSCPALARPFAYTEVHSAGRLLPVSDLDTHVTMSHAHNALNP